MDGTLCNDSKVIPKENIDAIIEMQKRGKTVAVVSGRPESGILPFIKELKLEEYGGYVLSYNGGRVYDIKNDKILYNCAFPKEYVKKVFDLVKGTSITVSSPLNDKIVAGNALNDYSYSEAKVVNLDLEFYPNFLDLDFDMNKLLLVDTPEVIGKYFPIIRDTLEPNLHVFLSEPFFLEITPPNIHKGNGLKALAEITGVPVEKMIAMGDSFNDIEMLEEAGLGVAMANCKKGVEKYADIITVSNNEAGVAKIINEFIL
jgi:Cof subfamily protein (haloacid dehalogenase superfamily)